MHFNAKREGTRSFSLTNIKIKLYPPTSCAITLQIITQCVRLTVVLANGISLMEGGYTCTTHFSRLFFNLNSQQTFTLSCNAQNDRVNLLLSHVMIRGNYM